MSEFQIKMQSYQKTWQQQLAEAIDNIKTLCDYLHLSIKDLPVSEAALNSFALRVPLNFVDCMEKSNPNDPLLRQVLPVRDELLIFPGFSNDPVGDLDAVTETGAMHKYHGRILLINTGSCAINCRYCFRRNFPYSDFQLSRQKEAAALRYITENTDLSEVILSGGDPLLLSDTRLALLIGELSGIEHIQRIRIHSRLPIVLPSRITGELIEIFSRSNKQIILVVHCNHPREINVRVSAACRALKDKGITLFNQSVLLKGVNDDAAVLCELNEELFRHGIIPYYLHMLDKASGTGHFDVPKAKALELIKEMQATLPGYLVPKLVREQAGEKAKQYVY